MNKGLFFITLFVFLFFVIGVSNIYAQETELVEIETPGLYTPKLLPDNPLYFAKTGWEKVRSAFTFNNVTKAKYQIILVEKRIAEASALIRKGKNKLAEKNIQRYEAQVDKVLARVEKLKEKGKDVESLITKLTENTLRHQEVLSRVYEKVPEQAKEAIQRAMEASKRGHERAKEAIQSLGKKVKKQKEVKEPEEIEQEPEEIE